MGKFAPKLRFPGFTENWIKKTIQNISTKITDGTHDTPKPQNSGIPFLTAIHVKDGQIDFENCYYLTKEDHLKIYSRCNPELGDLLMVNIGAGTATSARVNFREQFSLKNVALIKPNFKLVNSHFFEQVQRMNSSRLKHQISSGGAQPFLSLKEIGKLKLNLPTLPEQQKIATFLSTVDEKINLLKTQKSELERYKKGVMQKIFSQELRFKDEQGKEFSKWESKELIEIGEIVTGKTPSTKDLDLWYGDVQFVTPTDINEEKYQYRTHRTIKELAKTKLLPEKSIMFTCIASIGKMSLSVKPCVTNQQINSIIPFENFDNEFIYYSILNIVDFIKSTQSTNTLPIINKTEFSKFRIIVPREKKEQTKIANFLSALDEKIALNGEQITKMEVWKKGLLQQMFV